MAFSMEFWTMTFKAFRDFCAGGDLYIGINTSLNTYIVDRLSISKSKNACGSTCHNNKYTNKLGIFN